jgi:hypothetical protein
MFENEIINVEPRTNLYPETRMNNTDDTPTVADLFPPYATAHPVKGPTYKTYGELWRVTQSRADVTSFYLVM